MDKKGLQVMSVAHLLRLHADVIEELRQRDVVRTQNNPVGDYAEWLVANRMGMELRHGSSKSVDAMDAHGTKFQIKARRLTSYNKSVQLGAIRRLEEQEFDYLVGVLFNADFTVKRAARVPYSVVADVAKYKPHTNAHIVHLRDSLFEHSRVIDITRDLRV